MDEAGRLPPIDLIGGRACPTRTTWQPPMRSFLAVPGLGSRPLVVLVRGRADGVPETGMALWQLWQKRVALLSTSSILVRADDAGHAIQREPRS